MFLSQVTIITEEKEEEEEDEEANKNSQNIIAWQLRLRKER